MRVLTGKDLKKYLVEHLEGSLIGNFTLDDESLDVLAKRIEDEIAIKITGCEMDGEPCKDLSGCVQCLLRTATGKTRDRIQKKLSAEAQEASRPRDGSFIERVGPEDVYIFRHFVDPGLQCDEEQDEGPWVWLHGHELETLRALFARACKERRVRIANGDTI